MSYGGENNLPRCPNCELRTLERKGDDGHCWACGSDFPEAFSDYDGKLDSKKGVAMKTGQPANIQARHKYYEDNKEAIIKDLLSKGKPFTRRKWRIPKGSLSRIINKWLTPEQREKLDSIGITEFAEDGQLPQFPQFSNSWETPTQVKWLEVFEKLLNRQPLTEGKE